MHGKREAADRDLEVGRIEEVAEEAGMVSRIHVSDEGHFYLARKSVDLVCESRLHASSSPTTDARMALNNIFAAAR